MTSDLRPARSLEHERLTSVFNAAYSDYFVPLSLDEGTLAAVIDLWDIDLDASRASADGFAFLGIRADRGWIGGMGVVPSARRKGLGETLMHAVVEGAQSRGLREVTLEVLEQNDPARRLYEKIGFEPVRELEIWELDAAANGQASPVAAEDALSEIRSRRSWIEPWQRADETVSHLLGRDAKLIGLATEDGAAIVQPAGERSSIQQLAAVNARPLLAAAAPFIWLNVPTDDPAVPALRELGARVSQRQLELVLTLA
jgi:ribosomal protein S18 acetylase RimI-like enzyme